ncbi:cytochrome P450 [Pseudomonas sp. KSR10]|jgi:fatty-acid peroxygenase|uniref:cytochrome P450 n=1 Tax=Pseudomonas sp. KSR10 TaxID=2916654 RepID=UPI001EF8B279|nr:cytochrome P450 [Pseudomonas sp. KSR10]MCG6540026.1 cytochrome P450 [Pseudomonas sp. KSR10]
MPDIPRDSQAESSLSLLGEGYSFISSRCQRLGSDLFQVRLLMQNTICMRGEEAAKLFYDEQLFQRERAAPRMLQKTLFGQGGVQGLDDQAHRHRKQLFLSLLTEAAVADLVRLSEANWQAAIETWQQCDRVVLMPEVQAIFTHAACDWAGVPLAQGELTHRRDQLAAMIDGAGGVGARHWRARKARKEAESWMIDLVSRVRAGTLVVDETRPLAVVARYLDLDGVALEERVAAVEMLNLLRPIVAVTRFVIYAALELLAHPQWRQRLQQENAALELFAQEVRRLHAFFPFTAARVRRDFEWKGYHFPKGTRVLLDLYGTNRDARLWAQPEAFQPERFANWDGGAFNFITQGGGDAANGHRCPGEPLAIALLTSALRMLTRRMSYAVPAQDLRLDASRMPEQPESLLIISDVRSIPSGN